jgi:VIT1/CCC1 family predicted Fe2+/Mn2+ transporter
MKEGFLRNLVFGIEDSFASTLGVISGIAIAKVDAQTLLLTGIVLVFVEAFAMAAGSFLSEESVRELRNKRHVPMFPALAGSVVMFLSYVVAGALVLAPYTVLHPSYALPWSVGLSLLALFLLGVFSARMAKVPMLSHGFRMMLVGGVAIALGMFVARTVSAL